MKPIYKIHYSSLFRRMFKKLPKSLTYEVSVREQIFRKDCFDPRLDTHKLKGKYKKSWSFSITHKNRIMFDFLTDTDVLFISVGDHDIYR